MKRIAQSLAITGILQHKKTAPVSVVAETGVGNLIYTGFAPTLQIEQTDAIAFTGAGQLVYTGFNPSVFVEEQFRLQMFTQQQTAVGDTPWRVTYRLYDVNNNLVQRGRVIHNVNGVFDSSFTIYQSLNGEIPNKIDVHVQRMPETGPGGNNRTNDSGIVIWYHKHNYEADLRIVYQRSFTINQTFNDSYTINGILSGDDIQVLIWEG